MGDQRHPPATLSTGKGSSTHFTGGWVDLGPVLDRYGKSCPHRGSYGGLSSLWLVAIPTELSAATVIVPVLTYCLEYCRWMLHYVTAYSKLSCLTTYANTRPTQSNSTLTAKVLGYRERGVMK